MLPSSDWNSMSDFVCRALEVMVVPSTLIPPALSLLLEPAAVSDAPMNWIIGQSFVALRTKVPSEILIPSVCDLNKGVEIFSTLMVVPVSSIAPVVGGLIRP